VQLWQLRHIKGLLNWTKDPAEKPGQNWVKIAGCNYDRFFNENAVLSHMTIPPCHWLLALLIERSTHCSSTLLAAQVSLELFLGLIAGVSLARLTIANSIRNRGLYAD